MFAHHLATTSRFKEPPAAPSQIQALQSLGSGTPAANAQKHTNPKAQQNQSEAEPDMGQIDSGSSRTSSSAGGCEPAGGERQEIYVFSPDKRTEAKNGTRIIMSRGAGIKELSMLRFFLQERGSNVYNDEC